MRYLPALLLLILLILATRPYDPPAETGNMLGAKDPLPAAVSFSQDIFPFFEKKCNSGDCHGKEGKAFPKYRTYSMIKAKAKKVVKRLKDDKDPMPPADSGIKVSPEEISMLEAWIESGRPKN